jgi:hypothetical protein
MYADANGLHVLDDGASVERCSPDEEVENDPVQIESKTFEDLVQSSPMVWSSCRPKTWRECIRTDRLPH